MKSILVFALGIVPCLASLAQADPGTASRDQSRGASAAVRAPAGWEDAFRRGTQMILDGKPADAAALFQKVLQTAPEFAGAHYDQVMVNRVRQQAARTEQDPTRAKALIAEADRLSARARALRERDRSEDQVEADG